MQGFRFIHKMMAPMRPSRTFMQGSAFVSTPQRMFSSSTVDKNYNVSDDISIVPRISLDDFYGTVDQTPLTNEEALNYMTFAAKMAMVSFKNEEEMLSFKGDFECAL